MAPRALSKTMKIATSLLGAASLAALVSCGGGGSGGGGGGKTDGGGTTPPVSEAFGGALILGAPTGTGIKAKIYAADQSGLVHLDYGTDLATNSKATSEVAVIAGTPVEIALTGLSPDTAYRYRLGFRKSTAYTESKSPEQTFHTARVTGSTFSFTVQADSHLDENTDGDVYNRTLDNISAESPDFHIDLGDTFMCEKHSEPFTATVAEAPDSATVNARYAFEMANFARAATSTPLFLVNGNHDGELGWLDDGNAENLAVWTANARREYFPTAQPGAFYTGDTTVHPFAGSRASYYAWTWGDALFVVLDPYWNSPTKTNSDGWVFTLGKTQYDWLAGTLSSSEAKYKFVFIHNLVGGLDGQMRGGAEAAPYFEWGGKNDDGTDGFAAKRPGWAKPIHELLVENNVTAVFHGHDHLYAQQSLDGIIYQEVPQPSARNSSSGPALAAQYHYDSGTIESSSGHMKVTVGPSGVTADYIRTWLPENETPSRRNGEVAATWSVQPDGSSVTTTTFAGDVLLGSPTGTSIAANVYSETEEGEVSIRYGMAPDTLDRSTTSKPLTAGVPVEVPITGLSADTRYYYRVEVAKAGGAEIEVGETNNFHTARPAGSTFTFCLQGDSHPERENTQFDPELYERTLATAAAAAPDFYLLLGDDFSVDKIDPATVTKALVEERYYVQRPYLAALGRSSPLYLVNGNHEQAARYLLDGTADNVAVWAQNARNSLYAQPAPDGFYTGNEEVVPHIGLLRNHFAWTWGDALFVVIDPYWSSPYCVGNPYYGGPKRTDLWEITHGDAQYQWLKATLEGSAAKYKFVFAHHVIGTGRGGIELAPKYEWGGYNNSGSWGFTAKRPTWSEPIHDLMADNGVSVFFQGHDHIWATQELDGVIYQTMPEPADPNYSLFNADAFLSGEKYPNTGYARVTVSPDEVKVEYVRTYLPADETGGRVNGEIAYSYTIR